MTDASASSPTVVLVHGAFADAGSWAALSELLLAAGVRVLAPANPLRGIASDAAYTASVFAQIDGPVLAVGHSYGGAVISNAATHASNVVGLVFVAAFAPDENEVLGEVEGTSRDSVLGPALLQRTFPTGSGAETAVELYVNPESFHQVFAGDLPEAQSAVLAASQRPVAASAFDEKSGTPAWKTLPSWAVVATGDTAAGADVILSMAKRANATITELEGSHVIMISQPRAVADVILTALKAVSQ
ncbi:alpha/beta fold hydrolase [Leifsonia poae]|uniref:Alpha/beta hydrolase n=1 Tax=Leifsonia poae TaxID=110933 RepID=A0A9W6H7T5_9MICO|nr:alpha/beta hydrolase [Leifsonia poae]GLJ75190.1 alpha/beta hydrolase [Leifsonia poae]